MNKKKQFSVLIYFKMHFINIIAKLIKYIYADFGAQETSFVFRILH